jgi:glycosyltransferase involved in cell wall biosynthesis
MSERRLIVNLMPHGPAYEFEPGARPDVAWTRPDGSWVGFWKREWPDLLGASVLRLGAPYDWEVWQPDQRADREYAETLDTGVVHRLFPAIMRTYRPGLRATPGLASPAMLARIAELQHRPSILQLHGFRTPFYAEVLGLLSPRCPCRVVVMGHGLARTPIGELFEVHRPLTYLCLVAEQWKLRRMLRKVDVMSEYTTGALADLRRVYGGRLERIPMGCDFDFWTPVPSAGVRRRVRDELGIGAARTVFFASGNYIPRKQLDRLVDSFRTLERRDDWFLLLAGHGDRANTERLAAAAAPLIAAGKALMHPYVEGAALRNLYWAADVYVSVATDEGGPVSVMKAMACGLPVVTTPVGLTWELMVAQGVGVVVPAGDYAAWTRAFTRILEKGAPPALDLAVARRTFDWAVVAGRVAAIYAELLP